MDDLLLGIVAALRWRLTTAVICSTALAIAAFRLVPWLGGLQAIVLVVAGFMVGLVWEERAGAPSSPKQGPVRPTPRYVAAIAFAFGGAMWGALSSTSMGSAILGGLMLAGCLLLGSKLTVAKQRAATHGDVYLCFSGAIAAYAAAALSLGLPG